MPWDAVAGVAFEPHWSGRRLIVRLLPPADPRAAGVRWDLRGRGLRRAVERNGMRYAMRVLAVEPAVLAVAVAGHSGGRFRPVG